MDTGMYELRFTQDFVHDLDLIVDYISLELRAPEAARRLADDVQSAILERSKAPKAY